MLLTNESFPLGKGFLPAFQAVLFLNEAVQPLVDVFFLGANPFFKVVQVRFPFARIPLKFGFRLEQIIFCLKNGFLLYIFAFFPRLLDDAGGKGFGRFHFLL